MAQEAKSEGRRGHEGGMLVTMRGRACRRQLSLGSVGASRARFAAIIVRLRSIRIFRSVVAELNENIDD